MIVKVLSISTLLFTALSCTGIKSTSSENPPKEVSSKQKVSSYTGTVVRDCTGTYVRTGGKDYLVCNITSLQKYATGSTVSVDYTVPAECKEFDGTAVCMMYHEHAGTIRILKVK